MRCSPCVCVTAARRYHKWERASRRSESSTASVSCSCSHSRSCSVRSSLSKRRTLPHSGPASGLVASRNCSCVHCRSFSSPPGRNTAKALATRSTTPSVCTASSKHRSAFCHALLACGATPRASRPRCLLCATLRSAPVALSHCPSARCHLPCITRWSSRAEYETRRVPSCVASLRRPLGPQPPCVTPP